MKRNSLMLALLLLLFQGSVFAQPAFNIELTDTEGNSVKIRDIKGDKLTVLDFWATWCHPCVNSIPQLSKLSDKYADKGVSFIGINEDSPRNLSKVRPFASSLGITYPVLLDTDQQLLSNYMIEGFPTLIILDDSGKVLFTHLGYTNGDENILEKNIEELLTKME